QLVMFSRINDCYTGNSFLPGEKILPPPSNLSYSFIHICTLNWTWNPPENVSSNCNLWYSSNILTKGDPKDISDQFRVTDAHLNEEMLFRVRSECRNDTTTEPSPWVETSLLPKGILGTAAVDLSCVWHNLEYMACTWRPGQNASSDTNYTLFYWFVGDLYSHTNFFLFLCLIWCKSVKYTFELIIPFCISVKPATPRQLTVSKTDDTINVKWSESETFPKNCLHYEVKCYNGDLDIQVIEVSSETNSVSIPGIDPNSKYTFKVRAKLKTVCYDSHLHSDWSEEKSIGEKRDSTTYFVLIIAIPLIVAVSTVILLVYLKRLKILILPPIPDPREILKRMFGEQNEDSQVSKKLLDQQIY
uniref:Interleukin 13 receptor subunit alpha 1 n=1 Tax=Catharus ustulatus TaxID=91951 RepID=A0A8C3VF15_CATUS